MFTILIVLLILALGGGAVVLIFRHHRDPSAVPLTWPQRFQMLWAHLYRWATLARAGLRELWQRFQAWRDRKVVTPPAATAPAAPRPPAPRRPAGAAPLISGGTVLESAPVPVDVTPAEIPAVFAPVLAYITGFDPEEDTELMAFTRGLAAADLAMGDALDAQLGHCLSELGLDPVSVQGLADYADGKAEHAQGAMRIWHRFNAVYAEVKAFKANGGKLPKEADKFLTGEG